MEIILNIIILLFEVLYYSLFMKYARKDGKFYRYLILFVLFSITSIFLDKQCFISYMIIFLFILYGLKYIVRLKTSLYDLFIIITMFIIKVIIEIPVYLILSLFINGVLATFIFELIKIALVFLFKKHITKLYEKLRIKWNNNNFYVRYIFTILLYIYVIISCLFLILR